MEWTTDEGARELRNLNQHGVHDTLILKLEAQLQLERIWTELYINRSAVILLDIRLV